MGRYALIRHEKAVVRMDYNLLTMTRDDRQIALEGYDKMLDSV
jgi:hypothetical protein